MVNVSFPTFRSVKGHDVALCPSSQNLISPLYITFLRIAILQPEVSVGYLVQQEHSVNKTLGLSQNLKTGQHI